MSIMTDRCRTCGGSQTNFSALRCDECMAAEAGARADAEANGRDPNEAARAALAARAHTSHRNFVDPRSIDRRTIWLNGNKPPGVE